jgi:hypothetical protein
MMSSLAFGMTLFGAASVAAVAVLVWWALADYVLAHVNLPFLGSRSVPQEDTGD